MHGSGARAFYGSGSCGCDSPVSGASLGCWKETKEATVAGMEEAGRNLFFGFFFLMGQVPEVMVRSVDFTPSDSSSSGEL